MPLDRRFDDGTSRTIDFELLLAGELFGPLRDPELFARVSIDPEICTIVWPTGADFDLGDASRLARARASVSGGSQTVA